MGLATFSEGFYTEIKVKYSLKEWFFSINLQSVISNWKKKSAGYKYYSKYREVNIKTPMQSIKLNFLAF